MFLLFKFSLSGSMNYEVPLLTSLLDHLFYKSVHETKIGLF